MMRCSSCSTELPVNSRFCFTCGANLSPSNTDNEATIAMSDMPLTPLTPMSGSRLRSTGASAADTQRFPPGTLIASRYRVIARLGKGGMGEVFRADDLILGQPVALKFLPEAAASNPGLLARFYDEVRIARQVTHPNVCRVHDIGELQGQPYLSMAYIDGEDLGVLLRRIGHLPADKATEFSRKLCAGLAAAHAQGVLHRDLKPGNIMIDSQGQVLITDFGLAGIAEELHGAEVRNGTPAYMAPEQLSGEEVSARSDIYALGLVMYEMFTGRAPFEANSAAEMLRMRQHSRATNPSTLVQNIDPAVERAILRCLDPDPKMRPQTALAVAAALPGGDPLAAALAAGETPSPEVVAAAGTNEGLRPMIAIAALAGIIALVAVLLVFTPRLREMNKIPLENPPEALAAKARDIIRKLGYIEKPADSAYGFTATGYSDYLGKKLHGMAEWNNVLAHPPSLLQFWYRQSPRPLESESVNTSGKVTPSDPSPQFTGEVSAELDPDGRLVSFRAIPPEFDPSGNSARSADWPTLFAAADLDFSQFQAAPPQWVPLLSADSRAAWIGAYPGHPDLPIRIEAAAWHGKPVYFQIVWPWTKAPRMTAELVTTARRAADSARYLVLILIGAIGIVMARQNSKAGRGDHSGAIRFGMFAGVASLVGWLLSAHHVAATGEQALLAEAIADAVLRVVLLWAIYLALEPWVRRLWPQTLITWTRVLGGRFRDPMVGRDLLFSVLFGVAYCALIIAVESLDSEPSGDFRLSNLLGGRAIAVAILQHVFSGLLSGPEFFLMMFLLRVILRKQWLAAIAFVLIWTVVQLPQNSGGSVLVRAAFFMLIYGLLVTILLRCGLFALVVTVFLIDWINQTLLTTDFSAWYGLSSLVVVIVLGSMTAYGFWTSLGSRKLFDEAALER
jgi:serine/threonine-protein kinase